jgi:hypothetical protein
MLKRFSLYFFGVVLGIIVMMFWVNKKEQDRGGDSIFPYGPNARTLRSLETRTTRLYSDQAKAFMLEQKIDTSDISLFFKYADVDFSKSNPRNEPCPDYYLKINFKKQDYNLRVERCDSILTIKEIGLGF